MELQRLECVYTITEWYDGARAGIADYQDQPHYYECLLWENSPHTVDTYALTPLEEETFQLALEDWAIWQRWQAAFKAGTTTEATHPTLPEDQVRHVVLRDLLRGGLRTCQGTHHVVRGTFHYGSDTRVEWQPV
jgi:hypothetical protein